MKIINKMLFLGEDNHPGRPWRATSYAGGRADRRISSCLTAASAYLVSIFTFSVSAALDKPWQQLTNPTAESAAKLFASPPPEYSAQFTWGWSGPMDQAAIAKDLDGMQERGVQAAIIEPTAGMKDGYLTPGYFDLVKVAVGEAKKRNMRLWIMDDGDYPSGIGGGKFTTERPELRMQALTIPESIHVNGGGKFSREVGPEVIAVVAVENSSKRTEVLPISSGKIDWTAPAGEWEVSLAKSVFRSGPTKSANNPKGVKDYTHSLMDYLSPTAGDAFRGWMFESYLKPLGGELGKTVLGFRGDEPAYNFAPWTPRLFDEFQNRKGYDLRPYIAALSAANDPRKAQLTEEQRRVAADYFDVWSDLFRDNYFNMEARWCADHGVEMQLHVEHEEILPQLALANGDYFKCFREIQVPGVDIIWHQIWMDNPADFPKLASSAAHLYGHPRAFCEAFAAYRPAPDLKQARWLLDFLLVRGISRIEYMFWPSSARRRPAVAQTPEPSRGPQPDAVPGTSGQRAGGGVAEVSSGNPATVISNSVPANGTANGTANPGAAAFRGPRYYQDPGFPAVAAYVNRLSYLLGEGKPAAQIGLYLPSSSFWVANPEAQQDINKQFLALGHQFIEAQRDFDYVDEQALSSVLKLSDGEFVNLSGQSYRAIVIPPALAISKAALDRLKIFARGGGRVIFVGDAPALVVDKNFLSAKGPADISWATWHETSGTITPAVLERLPKPDLLLDKASPLIAYSHRRLQDADVYFIFNSGDEKASLHASLKGKGKAQIWDATTGKVTALSAATRVNDCISVPLELDPWSTAVVVLGAEPATTTAN